MNPIPRGTPLSTPPAAEPTAHSSTRLYRLTLFAFAFVFLILISTIPALRWHNTQDALHRLAAAEAEADRLDPGWRMEDLQARREPVADHENAALVLIEVAKLKPPNWPPQRWYPNGQDWYIDGASATLPLTYRLPDELLDLLRSDLYAASAALHAAVPLERLNTGRFPVVSDEQYLNSLEPARAVANLVLLDAMYRAHTGDLAGAAGCCRAAMAAVRAFGDEPSALSGLVRVNIASMVVAHLERVLALGECNPADLRELQRLIQREERTPVLLLALRGTRALEHRALADEGGTRVLESMAAGEGHEDAKRRRWTRSLFLSDQAWRAGSSALALDARTPAVEIAKRPSHEQAELFAELAEALKNKEKTSIAGLHSLLVTVGGSEMIARVCQRSPVRLRCADAALAVERYRLKHGKWPLGLDDLVPEFLPAVPLDPFTGQPLTFLRTEYGVVVYSFGQDRRDDGGDVEDDFTLGRQAPDNGFRLFEPRSRGRLPLPPDARPPETPVREDTRESNP